MAFSVAIVIRSSVLALVVLLAVVPHIYAQCNPNLYESLKANPQLQNFAEAIDLSDLEDRISKTDNVTVLAPTNDAFNGTNGLYQLLQLNNLTLQQVIHGNDNRVASVVLYHFLPPPTATVSQLVNGQSLPTALQGRNLTVSKTALTSTTTNLTFIGAASNATVQTADIRVCNSIVHIVNRVLLPATPFSAIPTYDSNTPAPGIAAASSSLAVGAWAFALSGALAAALVM